MRSVSLLLLVFLFSVNTLFIVESQKDKRQTTKPNIVFILTDDQDVTLNGLDNPAMNKTRTLLKNEGVFFKEAFVATPICCPSRSGMVSGRYIHNGAAHGNSVGSGCSSKSWIDGPEKDTYAVHVQKQGYRTFYGGKYLNQYGYPDGGGVDHVPPGWSEWFGLVGNSRFYDYTVSDNGKAVKYGSNYTTDYFTDVLKRRGIKFLQDTKKNYPDDPFLMVIATPAPHAPADFAPQYSNLFSSDKAPRPPSWNYYGSDKHWLIRDQQVMNDTIIGMTDEVFRRRWRSLASVDDLVEAVVKTLDDEGELENTFIFYFSDHGFHLGEFCQSFDKREPYENDIRVPFMVRGPGVPKGKVLDEVAVSIDLAPTFIDIAGGDIPSDYDGMSLKPILEGNSPSWRTDFLIDYYGEGGGSVVECGFSPGIDPTPCDTGNNTFHCLRTLSSDANSIYCELIDTNHFIEYYDINKDQYQLKNAVNTTDPKVIGKLKTRLDFLKNCSGESCKEKNPLLS